MAAAAPELPRLPELSQLYDEANFVPRRGQLMMFAGQPGAAKTFLALWLAQRLGLRTIYVSADSDPFEMTTRLAAMLSGHDKEAVAKAMDGPGYGYYEDLLTSARIWFAFDSSPTLDDIADELHAYVELWDQHPELIVVDNLGSVEAEMGEEFAGQRLVMREMHRLARETGAAVLVLHHTREEGDPFYPQARSLISGKVSQLPERILTVAYDPNMNLQRLAIVKNRGGKQDASGNLWYPLSADLSRATFH